MNISKVKNTKSLPHSPKIEAHGSPGVKIRHTGHLWDTEGGGDGVGADHGGRRGHRGSREAPDPPHGGYAGVGDWWGGGEAWGALEA